MTTTARAIDRQERWAPIWWLQIGPVDVGGLTVGEDAVGDPGALVGGAVAVWAHNFGSRDVEIGTTFVDGRITNDPTVTRGVSDVRWGIVTVPDVMVELSNADGALSSSLVGQPAQLSLYDVLTDTLVTAIEGTVSRWVATSSRIRVTLHSGDRSILETPIPTGDRVTTERFPLAVDLGTMIAWVWGFGHRVPCRYVRDEQNIATPSLGRFEYALCRRHSEPEGPEATANVPQQLLGLTRLGENQAEFPIAFTECVPKHGSYGINNGMETWTGGTTVAPDEWTLAGAGATIARDGTNKHSGLYAAAVTRVGTDCQLNKNLALADAAYPLAWWQGRQVRVTIWARATVASRANIQLHDGVGNNGTEVHTGGGAFEVLSVTRLIDVAATQVLVQLYLLNGNTTVQWDDLEVVVSARSWERDEALRLDLYPDYAAVAFILRQENEQTSRTLYAIAADLNGPDYGRRRNPARAIEAVLTTALGRTVNAPSFAQATIDASFTYEDAVLVDEPLVFLRFDDAYPADGAVDSSGRGHHGIYQEGGTVPALASADPVTQGASFGGDSYLVGSDSTDVGSNAVIVPYHTDFQQLIDYSVEIWYRPRETNTDTLPIVEYAVGGVTNTGWCLRQSNHQVQWKVNGGTGINFTLVDPDDYELWEHLVAVVNAGVLSLYRNGVPEVSAGYTVPGSIGVGDILVGIAGTPNEDGGIGDFDNFAFYGYALSLDRIQAHYQARLLPDFDDGPPDYVIAATQTVATPLYHWRLNEVSGATAVDTMGAANATYAGAPTLGVPGPLNPLQGLWAGDEKSGIAHAYGTAMRLTGNIAQYASVAGLTLAHAAASVVAWYTPSTFPDLSVTALSGSGLVEKTVGGVVNTQWLLFQEWNNPVGRRSIRWRVSDGAVLSAVDYAMVAEDVGRPMHLVGTYDNVTKTMSLYRNGVLVQTRTYAVNVTSGVGDLSIGKLASAYPCQGDLAHVSYYDTALTAEQVADLYTAGSWYQHGLSVDLTLTEPTPAKDVLGPLLAMWGMRLGQTAFGEFTLTVDQKPTLNWVLRDGPGDGERTLVEAKELASPAPNDQVKEVVLRFRPDLQRSGVWLGERRRTLAATGQVLTFDFPCVREWTTADRIISYIVARLRDEQTGEVVGGQECRQLLDRDALTVEYAPSGYTGQLFRAREIRKSLTRTEATIERYRDDDIVFLYIPASFPIDAGFG